jgi:ribonuclease HII
LLQKFLNQNRIEAGCDEAGRGCLAGPVCAAAVIMPVDYSNDMLNDSKKMTTLNRSLLKEEIEKFAIDYAVIFVDNNKIDEINILQASLLGMHKALDKLKVRPQHILVDGNKFNAYKNVPHTCIVKGDGKFVSIAAASVLAKTYRDEWMLQLHKKFNTYGWDKNKGYPTQKHRDAILEHGFSPYHRRSFHLLNTQLELSFTTTLPLKT